MTDPPGVRFVAAVPALPVSDERRAVAFSIGSSSAWSTREFGVLDQDGNLLGLYERHGGPARHVP